MLKFLGNLFKRSKPDHPALIESRERYEESNAECGRLTNQLDEAWRCLQDTSQKNGETISRLKDQLAEAQTRLQQVSQENRKTNQELTVKLGLALQEKDMVLRKCAQLEDAGAARVLLRAENVHALYLSKREIEAEIRKIVTTTASDWAEKVSPMLDLHASALSGLLAGVFLECHALVEERRLEVFSFFLCGSSVEQTSAMEMDKDTADFMLRHMRLHFKTMFPLTGKQFEDAYRKILNSLATRVSAALEARTTEEAFQLLDSSGLGNIVDAYLKIAVSATLQHPRVEFTDDCGEVQAFDPKVHADSIDGDHLTHGEKCVVVFPSFPPQKRFVLPALPK